MFENFDIVVCEVFKEAENQRAILKHEYVGTEHLLLAILSQKNSFVERLSQFNLTYDVFFKEVKDTISATKEIVKNNIYTPLLKRIISKAVTKTETVTVCDLVYYMLEEGEGVAIRILMGMNVDVDAIYNILKDKINNKSNLDTFKYGHILNDCININENVVGRKKEIDLIIETLLRKKKNNPILIGDAGVGKTAIVEELTRKIVNGDVPDALLDCKIVTLEMGELISGTRYRGEFEERLTSIIKEISGAQDVILFIDEIHTMVNAGAAEGAISAADMLKPYLARGTIKCIGATTQREYEEYFSKDKALIRRFEPIFVKEPNETETINILSSIRPEYVNYHKVNINEDTIKILVHLAGTYFPNRRNPDKSIELMDSVMSYVKLKHKSEKIKAQEKMLKKITIEKVREIEKGNYKSALKYNMEENKIKKEIQTIKNSAQIYVKRDDIIDVLEYKNNIIISKDKVNYLGKHLKSKYEKNVIDKILRIFQNDCRSKSIMIIGDPGKFVEDLRDTLGYELFKFDDCSHFDKLFNKVKYSPSTMIVVENYNSPSINTLLQKIKKDNLVEYKDEYISFNSVILIILAKEQNIGFNNNIISSIPIDEVISFSKKIKV